MKGVTISGGLYGLTARGAGSCVIASDCSSSECKNDGVYCYDNARMELASFKSRDHGTSAISVTSGAAMELSKCRLAGSKRCHGMHVTGEGTRATASDCCFQDCKDAGLALFSTGAATVRSCEFVGNRYGLTARGEGTRLTATDCTVSKSRGDGAFIYEGATAALLRLTAEGNGSSGVSVTKGASATLTGCALLANAAYHGMHASGAGTSATAVECRASGNKDAGAAGWRHSHQPAASRLHLRM